MIIYFIHFTKLSFSAEQIFTFFYNFVLRNLTSYTIQENNCLTMLTSCCNCTENYKIVLKWSLVPQLLLILEKLRFKFLCTKKYYFFVYLINLT